MSTPVPGHEPSSPLFPPEGWLCTVNEQRAGLGLRPLTGLDPLAMLLWHGVSRPPAASPLIVTGILHSASFRFTVVI